MQPGGNDPSAPRVRTGTLSGVRVTLALLIVLSAAAAARAATGADHVRVDVIADTTAVEPGCPFTLGVRFRIDPGWHIYWANPGDSGLPTRVTFDLPPGYAAGPVLYPAPATLKLPGGLTDYGYTGEVLLTARVVPPASVVAFHAVAHVDYLVCDENCIPGKAAATVDLPAGGQAGATHSGLFRQWSERVPVPLGGMADAHAWSRPSANGDVVLVEIRWKPGAAHDDPEWVPPPQAAYEVDDVSLTGDVDVTRIRYTLKPLATGGPTPPLAGVLTYAQPAGGRAGYTLPVPLLPPTRTGDRP